MMKYSTLSVLKEKKKIYGWSFLKITKMQNNLICMYYTWKWKGKISDTLIKLNNEINIELI